MRSFTDSFTVAAMVDTPTGLWVGTSRGLLRWDVKLGRYEVLGTREGLPSPRVLALAGDPHGGLWIATPRGVVRRADGQATSYAAAPVGDFIVGMVATADGRGLWAAGPMGLALLKDGAWIPYLGQTATTAVAVGGGAIWVGSSGEGVLRVVPSTDRVEQYGPAQGCDIDVVRAMAALDRQVLAVGDGPRGPRVALFDGQRFHSYTLKAGWAPEWTASAAGRLYVGAGDRMFEIVRLSEKEEAPAGAVELVAADPIISDQPHSVPLLPSQPSSALVDVAKQTGKPVPPKTAPEFIPRSPRLALAALDVRLPAGITVVSSSERGVLVGTRFVGAVRVENGVPRSFRAADLVVNAAGLTVACAPGGADDCYIATGAERAWRYDGQTFEVSEVDPEPGSRVLAMVADREGNVYAIHRGATDANLRFSRVDGGRWSPVAMQSIRVPVGVPALNFATFAPDGHLWVGLRYVDRNGEEIDFGAAEIGLESGKVVYHRRGVAEQDHPVKERGRKGAKGGTGGGKGSSGGKGPSSGKGASSGGSVGFALPNDVVAMYWVADGDGWFGTRSGAAHLKDGELRVFTENDGMDSEIIRDIGPGPSAEVWVATRKGTGRFDGTRWSFTKVGPFSHRATALGHDAQGNVFIGSDRGLFCVGRCSEAAIGENAGLLDDAIIDLSVDARGRAWVLTARGISVVQP